MQRTNTHEPVELAGPGRIRLNGAIHLAPPGWSFLAHSNDNVAASNTSARLYPHTMSETVKAIRFSNVPWYNWTSHFENTKTGCNYPQPPNSIGWWPNLSVSLSVTASSISGWFLSGSPARDEIFLITLHHHTGVFRKICLNLFFFLLNNLSESVACKHYRD